MAAAQNGFGGLTEGGRLERSRRCGVYPRFSGGSTAIPGTGTCCRIPVSTITQAKSAGMYTQSLYIMYGGLSAGGVSQSRVAALLAASAGRNVYSSEGSRIQQLQTSYSPGEVNGPVIGVTPSPIVVTRCPPLPAPPAPPATSCVLAKNERF
jgi:uncharacterized protein (DUF433 family)